METKIHNLVRQLGTDVSGKWIATEKVDQIAIMIIHDCMELNKKELSFSAFELMMNKYREHFGME